MFFLNFLFEPFENRHAIITERVLNAIIFALDLVVNRYANVGGSNQVRTWISPASWAFSIWALIYSTLFVFICYQLLPRSFNSGLINEGIHLYFMIATILNMFWLYVWPMGNYYASFLIIFLLWQSLAMIYIKMANVPVDLEEESNDAAPQEEESESAPLLFKLKSLDYEYLIVFIPFSMYFAWVSTATFVSLFLAFLPIAESDPFRGIPFAILAVLILAIMSALFVLVQQDVIFGLVNIWALIAISKGSQMKMWPGEKANSVYIATVCSATFLILAVIFVIGKKIWMRNVNRNN
jgi:hypothetical protein